MTTASDPQSVGAPAKKNPLWRILLLVVVCIVVQQAVHLWTGGSDKRIKDFNQLVDLVTPKNDSISQLFHEKVLKKMRQDLELLSASPLSSAENAELEAAFQGLTEQFDTHRFMKEVLELLCKRQNWRKDELVRRLNTKELTPERFQELCEEAGTWIAWDREDNAIQSFVTAQERYKRWWLERHPEFDGFLLINPGTFRDSNAEKLCVLVRQTLLIAWCKKFETRYQEEFGSRRDRNNKMETPARIRRIFAENFTPLLPEQRVMDVIQTYLDEKQLTDQASSQIIIDLIGPTVAEASVDEHSAFREILDRTVLDCGLEENSESLETAWQNAVKAIKAQ